MLYRVPGLDYPRSNLYPVLNTSTNTRIVRIPRCYETLKYRKFLRIKRKIIVARKPGERGNSSTGNKYVKKKKRRKKRVKNSMYLRK